MKEEDADCRLSKYKYVFLVILSGCVDTFDMSTSKVDRSGGYILWNMRWKVNQITLHIFQHMMIIFIADQWLGDIYYNNNIILCYNLQEGPISNTGNSIIVAIS